MEHPIQDKRFVIGLGIYAIAVLLFIGHFFAPTIFTQEGVFFLNFALFILYRFVIWEGWWKFPNRNRNIIWLLIGNVSAYSLNRLMPVFAVSTNWLATFLVLLNVAMLLYCFRKQFPIWVQYSMVAILGTGVVFNFYETLYIAPLYGFSLMAAPFFLISLHSFIPLWWLVLLTRIILPYFQKGNEFRSSLLVGLLVPIILAGGFVLQWFTLNEQIKDSQDMAAMNKELPAWVQLSRTIEDSWLSRKVLKADLLYKTLNFRNLAFMPENMGRNERKKHDPLIVVGALLSKPLSLDGTSAKHLLNAVFNQRHQTEQKFWSGKNLSTSKVETTIQFFPAYRLAYTEKVIQIKKDDPNGWPRQQEALYTFHVPEGSVITSASLWVEGEERPSLLTTRNKADSAYAAIVGRERRDPLLLHWQEGNRVTVRVFPVRYDLPRQFKIGITSPLQEKEGKLRYENSDFEGPYWENAKEEIRILGASDALSFLSKLRFKKQGEEWTYEGSYHSDWDITVEAGLLSDEVFSFDGQHFQLIPYQPSTTAFEAKEIYLDINKSWSKRQFNKIWELVKHKKVFVYTTQLERMTESNKIHLFDQLQQYRFNLFPFHNIAVPEQALLITQTTDLTPVLNDVKGSPFATKLSSFFQQNDQPIKVFDLGASPSLYLKSLAELRSIQLYAADYSTLENFLQKDIFIKNKENEQLVVLPEMGIGIQQVKEPTTTSDAPDHLMRLYTYNYLMKQIGRNYFGKDKLADELVAQAERSFVVSPVSSLIVLETQADYDRFDIKNSKNSLKNASIKNAGSVPEPHEWLLIGLGLLVMLLLKWKLS